MEERKQRKLERREQGEVDERMVDDDDFDLGIQVVDFSRANDGMGNKRFTSKFSFMQKDTLGKVDKRWDGGDAKTDASEFFKRDGPSASEEATAERAKKRAEKKAARQKTKEAARARAEEDASSPKAQKRRAVCCIHLTKHAWRVCTIWNQPML